MRGNSLNKVSCSDTEIDGSTIKLSDGATCLGLLLSIVYWLKCWASINLSARCFYHWRHPTDRLTYTPNINSCQDTRPCLRYNSSWRLLQWSVRHRCIKPEKRPPILNETARRIRLRGKSTTSIKLYGVNAIGFHYIGLDIDCVKYRIGLLT